MTVVLACFDFRFILLLNLGNDRLYSCIQYSGIWKCTHFVKDRNKFLSKRYFENPNVIKLNKLMNTCNEEKLKKNCQDLLKIFLKSALPKNKLKNMLYCKLNFFSIFITSSVHM